MAIGNTYNSLQARKVGVSSEPVQDLVKQFKVILPQIMIRRTIKTQWFGSDMITLPTLHLELVRLRPLPPALNHAVKEVSRRLPRKGRADLTVRANLCHIMQVLSDLPSLGPMFNPADLHIFNQDDLNALRDEYHWFAHEFVVLHELKVISSLKQVFHHVVGTKEKLLIVTDILLIAFILVEPYFHVSRPHSLCTRFW